ncbi:cupredoxin family protein [Ramlibacter sp. AW1]|uniref:Cupredoxin family protein n=1 Tax=Ramlibacter aurantiacus TaxID=2801330 RepID=A0A937D269_9BURK|nr:cupredoxin family protein [Ramlibacter aurantiacus]MBL0421279.1 cupredoxin family protein [Ramlibacter aurantiacus]
MNKRLVLCALAACASSFLAVAAARAHESHGAPKAATEPIREQQPWGIAGDARNARRTIRIDMGDDMRFSPSRIQLRQGETVRFVVQNKGKVMHEMVIGTRQALDEHAALMQKFPNMEHDEPHMAHVSPGKRGELVWTFNRAGSFDFACLIPGHYQAGMVGRIDVIASKEVNR